MICCCDLAGTAACQYCSNNPEAKPSPYTIVESSTYTTGHNTYETVAFEKLKMITPLDRAVVFPKGADEMVEVAE